MHVEQATVDGYQPATDRNLDRDGIIETLPFDPIRTPAGAPGRRDEGAGTPHDVPPERCPRTYS